MNDLLSSQGQQVLTLGREKYWGFRVAEGVGVLSEETYVNGWWYLPVDSIQKKEASKRIEAIKKYGIGVRQVIIAHESPKLLCGPRKAPQVNKGKVALWVAGGVLAATGIVLAAIAVAIILMYVLIPLMIGAVFVMMVGLGVLVDPVAIVVLNDGTRIEVLRWVE